MRDRVIIPAAVQLSPFQQGDGSALCGLYSILNAIQLALWPRHKLTRKELKQLISITAQSTPSGLLDVLGYGINEEPWLALSRQVLTAASEMSGYRLCSRFILRGKPGARTATAMQAIKRQLQSNRPVLVMLWGAYNHATVISGMTPQRVHLFDSCGFKWVRSSSIGLEHPWSSKIHRISKRSAMAILRSEDPEW